ncbi:PREDICTED: succinate dehydrogenase [ubiquinone] cytochrome b small subunit, mitochondrial [Dinoponera quadriceps]|uniref:Succinate dehydrogenase [ubiquinone] cytochrome b small subunit n=1 Tax=Dinoponera quadriceps TaxID=609295 RepID=A0A6P3XM64_DINQU|nr:PREDICTED: succinate dehydrogenase [ubiquinone] cytochrome b small subunit, mitochondrial [Dinoponera quadriceps]XP_014479546.1 PREDICTED: succinate dehydrogenase [ubiquinone] cytochrome b small subunit, mitochondrial [Dinoponera quadriceps]XP_014479548.1 PREDICTED: succinate dehydrogenase [ubiquinone] cytochrome b small subunit, mitochondrial [Dinoponera quadriceps]
MNLGRVAGLNIFNKVRQFETLAKPAGLLVRRCGPTQFPKPTSSFANLNRCAIANTSNCSKYRILSKLPARLTVNISQARAASARHGDHVRTWVMERLVAVSFLALIPAALMFENKVIDAALAINIVMHFHWGLEAIIIDYVRPIVVGTIAPKIAALALNLLSAATLAGLLLLIYNGPGLAKVIKQGWAINGKRKAD